MITLPDFCTNGNNVWEELTGVSTVGSHFLLQNLSKDSEFMIAFCDTFPLGDFSGESIAANGMFKFTNNGKKVWVRSGETVQISALQLDMQNIPYNLSVSMYAVSGHAPLDKFGTIRDLGISDTPMEVCEGCSIFGRQKYDATNTAPDTYISSTSTSDVGQLISVSGNSITGESLTGTAITNGQNPVKLPEGFWRIWRASNDSDEGNEATGNIYIHQDQAPVAGIPANNLFRAMIDPLSNQTLMAVYTIPLGFVGFLHRGELGAALEGNAGALAENARIQYQSRRVKKLFKVKKEIGLMIGGSSIYKDPRSFPDVIPALTDIRILVTSLTNPMDITSAFDIELVDQRLLPQSLLDNIDQPLTMPI